MIIEMELSISLSSSLSNATSAENYLKNEKVSTGTFVCWKTQDNQTIISSKSKKEYNHIVVPIKNHSSLAEAVTILQLSFPSRYIKHAVVNQLEEYQDCCEDCKQGEFILNDSCSNAFHKVTNVEDFFKAVKDAGATG